MAEGKPQWKASKPLPWDRESDRFFAAIKQFDDYLASGEALQAPVEKLFHGPVADALTHVGQLAMMRRLAGCLIKAENYFAASVEIGRVGPGQTPPERTF